MTPLKNVPVKRKVKILEVEKKQLKDFASDLKTQLHYAQPPLKIEEVCRSFSMSPSKFKNLFKEVNGDSYYSYFLKNKLAQAAEMLGNGKKLKEVSELFGYSQPIKFLIVFKKYYGTTTKKFAREYSKAD